MKSKTIFFKEKTLSKWFKFPQRYWPASLELTDLHNVWNWWTTVLIEYVKGKKKKENYVVWYSIIMEMAFRSSHSVHPRIFIPTSILIWMKSENWSVTNPGEGKKCIGLPRITRSNESLDKNHIYGEAAIGSLKVAAGEMRTEMMLCSKSKLLLAQV